MYRILNIEYGSLNKEDRYLKKEIILRECFLYPFRIRIPSKTETFTTADDYLLFFSCLAAEKFLTDLFEYHSMKCDYKFFKANFKMKLYPL